MSTTHATTSVQVTATDNECYFIAFNGTTNTSYQLCHILSGFNNLVDVTFNITAGTYVEPDTLNGTMAPLFQSYTASIPSGSYPLMAIGIDWGGGQQLDFSVTSGGQPAAYGTGGYHPGPFPGGGVFYTNNGKPVQAITI
eukprot:TRINITY_DN65070_c0_g1_i1.p1 TRINITY_DN65070_c0_g1~~TRINITY_DN65070_c0_g1_i1.p1  ORF type:complete len:156 (+),score=7.45 TRINITY_DN65070_c0_g1_i1:50-469(+)